MDPGNDWVKLHAKQIDSDEWRSSFFKENLNEILKKGDSKCWTENYAN